MNQELLKEYVEYKDGGELSGKEHIFPIETPDGSFVGQPIDL